MSYKMDGKPVDITVEIVKKFMTQTNKELSTEWTPKPIHQGQSTSGSSAAAMDQAHHQNDSNSLGSITPTPDHKEITTIIVEGWNSSVFRVDEFTRIIHRYKIINVMSPFEFYVIREEDVVPFECGRIALTEMQKHFDMMESKDAKYKIDKPQIHCTYGIWCEAKKKWQRVRLVDFDTRTRLACVFLFDDCLQLEYVHVNRLRSLPYDAATAPCVPMYRAHLYDVIPVNESMFWSSAACDWFKEMLKDKNVLWKGLQMSWNRRDLQKVDPKDKLIKTADPIIDVGMVLFEDEELNNIKDSLNWIMVQKGFGKPIGIGATSSTMLCVSKMMPNFLLNKKIQSIDEKNIPDCLDTIDIFAAYRMCQVVLVYSKGPSCFYVQNLSKIVDLKAMERSLQKVIAELPKVTQEDELEAGESVIFSGSDQETKETVCYRSVILAVENNMAEVILVDYGNIMKVKCTRLYRMPVFYASIPSYAHRIHLKTIRPQNLGSNEFSKKSSHEFNKLMSSMVNNVKPAAFFVFRSDAKDFKDVVELQKIHQDLVFNMNQDNCNWKAGPFKETEKLDEESCLKMRGNPMLASHFVSFGADVLFMKKTYEDVLWKIYYLTDEIVQDKSRFEMELIGNGDRFDKEEYYRKLIKFFGRYWTWGTVLKIPRLLNYY